MRVGSCRVFCIMPLVLVSDESGDLGLGEKATPTYVVLLLVFRGWEEAKKVETIAQDLAKRYFRYPIRKWSEIKGKHKNNPELLASFITDLRARVDMAVKFPICGTAVILDKFHIDRRTSPALFAYPHYRMGWCYGLIFKRLGPFLDWAGQEAEWIIDENSPPEKKNIEVYISELLPLKQRFRKRYGKPRFRSRAEHPILTLADFLAGLTRRCFESYKAEGKTFAYLSPWERLKPIFYRNIMTSSPKRPWKWRGLLYWPLDQFAEASNFLL